MRPAGKRAPPASGAMHSGSRLVLALLLLLALGSGALLTALALWEPVTGTGSFLRAAGAVLCAVYIAACFLYLFAVHLPLCRLSRAMAQVVDGTYDDLLREADGRELPGMPRQFNAFLTAIRQILHREYSNQLLKKKAELNALQSQINPHFLYNTIDSIRGQALLEGSPAIAGTAKALASIFRYCIDNPNNMVTLREELRHVSNYFAIQQYRFHDRFALQIDLEEGGGDLLACYVPKLSIQPLVENAIGHGLEAKMGKGTVRIQVQAFQSRLVIVVEDDGVGIREQTLAQIQEALRLGDRSRMGAVTGKAGGNRFALLNVHERIRIAFGDGYGLRLYSTYGVGTQCQVSLPILWENPQGPAAPPDAR